MTQQLKPSASLRRWVPSCAFATVCGLPAAEFAATGPTKETKLPPARFLGAVKVTFDLLLALLVCVAFAASATPTETDFMSSWAKRLWQTDEGLPDNSVTGVVQTDDGYLWVATLGGLIRFNGAKFEEFSMLHIPGVANRVVRQMFLDRRGRLWLAMDRGSVVCLDAQAARVFNHDDGLEDSRITGFAEDAEGGVWMLGLTALYRAVDGRVSRFGAEAGLPGGAAPWIASDGAGEVWYARGSDLGVVREGAWRSRFRFGDRPVRMGMARDGGLWVCAGPKVYKCSPAGNLVERAQLPGEMAVTMVFEDKVGALWIGTASGGLFRLDAEALERVETSHEEIACAMQDREGTVWIGTMGGGLNQLHARAIDLLGARAGLPSESTRSVCQDADGWFWVGLNNGSLARGRSNHWEAVTAADGWPGGNIICVAAARDGGVWIGTRDRGLQFLHDGKCRQWSRADGLGSVMVRSVLVAGNGDVWVATHSPDRLVRFRDGEFLPLSMPGEVRDLRALAEGTDGTIWAGTSGGYLLRVLGTTMIPEPAVQEARPLSVRSLHVTPDGCLWIGYAGWGLGRLAGGHYTRLTMNDGLHDDYISQIQSDDQGGLWLTSNHGLFLVAQEELAAVAQGSAARVRSIVYGRSEGLGTLQASFDGSPNYCRSADGDLFFATRNGLLRVQPDRIRDNTNPPPVVLERVIVDDRAVALWESRSPLRTGAETNALDLRAPGAALRLAPGHRKLGFEFAALSLASSENARFRYRLENFDQDWNEADKLRAATYPRLAAGRYAFQVQACNNAGVWNLAGFRLPIEVTPFVWQTWWFQSAAVLAFAAGIAGLARYFSFRRLKARLDRLERQAALQQERTRIARDIHDEVGSKLSRLSLLSEIQSQQPELPASGRADAAEISETARDTIRAFEEIIWALNPKNDSLAQLMNYLCRFAEELFEGGPTQCVFDLPEPIPDVDLPTGARHHLFLATKEALHNVLKHAQATRVCVRLVTGPERFEIQVEDNGRGLGPEPRETPAGAGNGLENMRERMKQVAGQLELQSGPEGGTRVTFRLGTLRRPG